MKKRFVSLALILMLCGCQLVPGGDDTGKDQQIGVANVVNENVDNPVIDDGNNTDTQNDNDEDSFFAQFEETRFYYMSGVGGWETNLHINADGSFNGIYYDSDMGASGVGFPNGVLFYCAFNGKFTNPVKIDDYTYEITIDSLEYEYDPEEEEDVIIQGTDYVFCDAYGLTGTDKLEVYLPGKPYSELSEEYKSWVWFTAYDEEPDTLEFAGLYNPSEMTGFYAEQMNADELKVENNHFVVNQNTFPGMTNSVNTVYPDGTYFVEDNDLYGVHTFYNVCTKYTGDDSKESIVNAAIESTGLDSNVKDLVIVGEEEQPNEYKMTHIGNRPAYYVLWQSGSNEDTRQNRAKVLYENGFVYIFDISTSEYDVLFNGELSGLYLNTLRVIEFPLLSCESIYAADRWTYAYVKADMDNYELKVDEVVVVSSNDEDLMEQYGLTIDDMPNDYAVVEKDKFKTANYEVNCPVYMQSFETRDVITVDQYMMFTNEYGMKDGMLMIIIKDENGDIVFMYQPYFP